MKSQQEVDELAQRFLDVAQRNLVSSGCLESIAYIENAEKAEIVKLSDGESWNDPSQRDKAAFWLRRRCRELNATVVVTVFDAYVRRLSDEALSGHGMDMKHFYSLPSSKQASIYDAIREKVTPSEAIHITVESDVGFTNVMQVYRRVGKEFEFEKPEYSASVVSGRMVGFLPRKGIGN